MTITTSKLGRAAGIAAIGAGLLYVLVQLIHPEENADHVTTTAWTVTHLLTGAMCVLGLIGISGMYFREVKETGVLGLIGYLLFGAFFLIALMVGFAETVVLPTIADELPGYVNDFLGNVMGEAIDGDVGSLATANLLAGITYALGGVLFGVALYRARILARWASLLLAIGAIATPILVSVLPDDLIRVAAIPVGAALVGLGYSLWREERTVAIPEGRVVAPDVPAATR
jgi:hypothetical protein